MQLFCSLHNIHIKQKGAKFNIPDEHLQNQLRQPTSKSNIFGTHWTTNDPLFPPFSAQITPIYQYNFPFSKIIIGQDPPPSRGPHKESNPLWGLGTPNTSPWEINHPMGMQHIIKRPYIKHPTPTQSTSHPIWKSLVSTLEYNNQQRFNRLWLPIFERLNEPNISMHLTPTGTTHQISKYQLVLIHHTRRGLLLQEVLPTPPVMQEMHLISFSHFKMHIHDKDISLCSNFLP